MIHTKLLELTKLVQKELCMFEISSGQLVKEIFEKDGMHL